MNSFEASAGPPPFAAVLAGEQRADVCVIGGGYTGWSAALHLAVHYGYSHLRMLDREQMRASVASSAYVAGRLDEGGGHLHPLRFALGLAQAATVAGVRVFEHSAARSRRLRTQAHAEGVPAACPVPGTVSVRQA